MYNWVYQDQLLPKAVGWTVLSAVLFTQLTACSLTPALTEVAYSSLDRGHLYDMSDWAFTGRIAFHGQGDSWSANIVWSHSEAQDVLKLSGLFGQGAVIIVSKPNSILIDHGDGQVEYSEQVNQFIVQRLGFFVPILALRYWVLGLTEPNAMSTEYDDGFMQLGWKVSYKQFVPTKEELMPYKIRVIKDKAKLKLIIDEWVIHG